MSEARLWKLLRNSEAQPKFTLSYKKNKRVTLPPFFTFEGSLPEVFLNDKLF